MKVKDLIKKLTTIDPELELDVWTEPMDDVILGYTDGSDEGVEVVRF